MVTRTLETDGWVGADPDDLDALTKLADDVGLTLLIDYVNELGQASRRAIQIDGVFGDTLDAPRMVTAIDSRSGERRKFRLDRITAVHRGADRPPRMDNIPWLVGAMVREKVGAPVNRPPLNVALADLPVVVREECDGVQRELRGHAVRFQVSYLPDGPVSHLQARLAPTGEAGLRPVRYRLPPFPGSPALEFLGDGETGEEIDDIYAWAAVASGLTADGFEPH